MRTNTREEPFPCGKRFSTTSGRNIQNVLHTGERPHACPQRFSAPSNLYYHKMTHTKNAFKEDHTGWVIFLFCETGKHTNNVLHTGERPHECPQRFSAPSNLYYHKMTHTKVKAPANRRNLRIVSAYMYPFIHF
ncbi:unnamed protein product, partial [Cyprideis torosa]